MAGRRGRSTRRRSRSTWTETRTAASVLAMPMTIDDGRAYVALAAYNFHSLRSLIGRSLASGLGGPLRRAFYTAALSLFKTGPQEIQLFFSIRHHVQQHSPILDGQRFCFFICASRAGRLFAILYHCGHSFFVVRRASTKSIFGKWGNG